MGDDKGDFCGDLEVCNKDVKETVTPYHCWLEARVRHMHAKLLEEYLHTGHALMARMKLADAKFEQCGTQAIAVPLEKSLV